LVRRDAMFRIRFENEWRQRRLVEVELAREIAEPWHALADRRAGVGSPVARRIQTLAAEEPILDQLEVGVERERLVVDHAATGPRADEQAGDADAVSVLVDPDGLRVVVEPAPVVPGDEHGG